MRTIQIKRVYEPVQESDGKRVLVDRLWPRGLTKEQVAVDVWMKDIAPSTELRKQFNHKPELFPMFKEKYIEELYGVENEQILQQIYNWSQSENVTLVYASKDEVHNHAAVIKGYIEQMM